MLELQYASRRVEFISGSRGYELLDGWVGGPARFDGVICELRSGDSSEVLGLRLERSLFTPEPHLIYFLG